MSSEFRVIAAAPLETILSSIPANKVALCAGAASGSAAASSAAASALAVDISSLISSSDSSEKPPPRAAPDNEAHPDRTKDPANKRPPASFDKECIITSQLDSFPSHLYSATFTEYEQAHLGPFQKQNHNLILWLKTCKSKRN